MYTKMNTRRFCCLRDAKRAEDLEDIRKFGSGESLDSIGFDRQN
jgi:hypothetical protein